MQHNATAVLSNKKLIGVSQQAVCFKTDDYIGKLQRLENPAAPMPTSTHTVTMSPLATLAQGHAGGQRGDAGIALVAPSRTP
jgi:hypothetical protein